MIVIMKVITAVLIVFVLALCICAMAWVIAGDNPAVLFVVWPLLIVLAIFYAYILSEIR